jgi:hypothetical protein
MRGFKSAAHLQRFASVHGVVQNLFRVGRHLLRSVRALSAGLRRMGRGDVCLLNERGRSTSRRRTCRPHQVDSARQQQVPTVPSSQKGLRLVACEGR